MTLRWLLAGLFACAALPASAVTCDQIDVDGTRYTVCEIDVPRNDLRLFLNDETGAPYGQFTTLDRALAEDGKRLVFAMNAGMYHEDRRPVGHYVEDGAEKMRVIASAGPGNFGLLPNGILCIRRDRADVIETTRFLSENPACLHATQSGPMLVIDGDLHPRFLPQGTSRYVRNGVGTSDDGRTAVFVLSEAPVNFHDFASFFRDTLGLRNALYLDGNVSRLYAPDIGRSDFGLRLGPIVAVTAPAP